MSAPNDLTIVPLTHDHLASLVALYQSDPADYSGFFTPFAVDLPTLEAILEARREDGYFTLLVGGEVAGLYILRGFDEGYKIPAYGVWIGYPYKGRGLATAALYHALDICRERGCTTVMIKVHPTNVRSWSLYERLGFQKVSVDERSGSNVYHLTL